MKYGGEKMLCKNCSSEIQEDWVVCPKCGCQIIKNKVVENIFQESKEYDLLGMRRTGRFSFWKIPSTIKIEGENIQIITKGKKIIESQFRKQDITEIDFPILPIWKVSDIVRLVIFGLMMFLTYGLSIFAVLFSVKIAVSRHLRMKLSTGETIKVPICQKADASDFLRELNYPEAEIAKINAKKISDKKWAFREWIIYILLIFVATFTMYFGLEMTMNNTSEETQEVVKEENREETKEEVRDYSDADIEGIIGESEDMLEDTDFIYSEDEGVYQILDGDVMVECIDGKIYSAMITGDSESTPSFHGVRIGMAMEEAVSLLSDKYSDKEESEDGTAYIDLESKIGVMFRSENDSITGIIAMQLTEEDIRQYLAREYIFPDSDKKYLSEDEVRSVTADELFIGRNEIFARHGYIFTDEGLQEHFTNTSWYEGSVSSDQFNVDSVFNDFEKKNAELIKKIEDEVNGINISKEAFIGMEGVYICTNTIDDMTGKVEVLSINEDTITFSLGILEGSAAILTENAQIINSNTAQIDLYGFIITFAWSDAEHMFITNQGEISGMDSGVIFPITDGRGYVRPLEFNQW